MRLLYFAIAGGVLGLDQASKAWISHRLASGGTIEVIPQFFNLIYTRNQGMALGFLSDSASPLRNVLLSAFAGIIILVVSYALATSRRRLNAADIALSLILGGAAGNLIDRVTAGSVVDFLDFYFRDYHWHTFNIADSAIVCGAILFAITLWTPRPKPSR